MENGFDSVDKYLRVSRQDLVKMGIKDVCHRDKILSSLKDFESNCWTIVKILYIPIINKIKKNLVDIFY
jgi:hypothetical protein